MKKLFLFLVMVTCIAFPLRAQTINIDADKQVEWHRNEQKIIASGNAVATKNGSTLHGNTITAFYEKVQLEDGTQKTQLQKILSDGNVKLEMNKSTAFGEHFSYDLPTLQAKLTGNPAKIENDTGTLTATQSITYDAKALKSTALGEVIARNPDYTIYSNKMVSYFDEDKKGQKTLNHVDIFGEKNPIKIVNKQAVVTGARGTYFPSENKLKIYDNVVITQDENILKGDYAETDLKTGISRLLSTQQKGGRVSGVFHSKKKK